MCFSIPQPIRRHSTVFFRNERGTSFLEMAFVMPFLMAIGLGVFEFGNVIYQRHLIEGGVRDAARYLAGVEFTAANVTIAKNIAAYSTTDTSGPLRVQSLNDPVTQISIPLPGAGAKSIDNSASIYRGPATIYIVGVTANVPYQDLGYLNTNWIGLGPITITVTHEERHYGNR